MTYAQKPVAAALCENPITLHRLLIIEKVCLKFGNSVDALRMSLKNSLPWKREAAVAAYLLRCDTNANRSTIAGLLCCDESTVPSFIRSINRSITERDKATCALLCDIRDDALDAIGDDGAVVWHRRLAPDAHTMPDIEPALEKILDTLQKTLAVPKSRILSPLKSSNIVLARNAAFCIYLYLVSEATLTTTATVFDKTETTVRSACIKVIHALTVEEPSDLMSFVIAGMETMDITDRHAFISRLRQLVAPKRAPRRK